MDILSILKGVECDCGKFHTCNIESVYIESGAIARLSALCEKYKGILLVADENTYKAAGEQTRNALGSHPIDEVIFSGDTLVIPNEDSIEKINEGLGNNELIIGIGSGVIQDLCKYVSHFSKVPYMVVATATSMDGYASTGAAMILKGMKETVPAGLPLAIIADTGVLKNAPMEMIKAGYGDVIGKYSALNDWELSREVNGEYFCQYIYDTTYQMIEKTRLTAAGLLKRDEESIRTLMEALVVVGIMMSFATSSRPASGSEHHLSHFFEITGILNSEPYFPHGVDVAYSTVITAEIREKLLKCEFPKAQFCEKSDTYKAKMEEIYGSLASECMSLQKRIGNYEKERTEIYRSKEEKIRAILEKMPSAEEIKNMLLEAELDIKEFYELYGEKKIRTAVKYAKDLKDRYTVLWMNYDILGGEE